MACGRPKNLEIAARNLLCGSRDRRRNFFTTRDGNRRRGNPEPPGKGQLRAFGQGEVRRHGEGETPRHRCGGNPGPPGIGQTLGPLVSGKARCRRQGGSPQGWTPSHPAQGKLQGTRRRGNPELCAEKKALSRRRREDLSHLAWGQPRSFGERKPGATGEGITWRHLAWGKPRARWQRGKPEPRRGEP